MKVRRYMVAALIAEFVGLVLLSAYVGCLRQGAQHQIVQESGPQTAVIPKEYLPDRQFEYFEQSFV
jgi:hypothetical protein